MAKRILSTGLAASLVCLPVSAATTRTPEGSWLVQDKTAVVRITKCPGGFCGYVAKGQEGKDYRNPDPAKRSRSVIGIQVIFDMKPAGPDSWSGVTYDSEDGQLYDARLNLNGSGALKIEGCVPKGGACGSQTWTREP